MSTVQDSLTPQQFDVITSSLLQSPRITRSFICVRITVLNCPLFPFNGCFKCNRLQRNVLSCS